MGREYVLVGNPNTLKRANVEVTILLCSFVGKKFGIIQIKLALVALVHNYVFYPSPKMRRPVEFKKKVFITSIEGGAWVRAEPREQRHGNSHVNEATYP